MDIKDLTVFKKVAEEGSISKATKSLSYVQSNKEMQIMWKGLLQPNLSL
ncbi:hypothetical protein [Bacillus pseudomycoides]